MKRIRLKEDKSILEDISALYLEAFPENERPPLSYFLKCAEKESNDIYGYYDNDEFIGFSEIIKYQNIIYISYLAVHKTKRNKGYGTKILNDIKYSFKEFTILLCYEEVDIKYVDYQNRVNRENFYIKNGFTPNGLKTREGEVVYQSAQIGKEIITFPIYKIIFDLCYGEGTSDIYLKKYIA